MSATLIPLPVRDAGNAPRRSHAAAPARQHVAVAVHDAAPHVHEQQPSRMTMLLQLLAQLAVAHGGYPD